MSTAYKKVKAERDVKEAANPDLRVKRLANQRAYSVKIKDSRKTTESTEQRTDRLASKALYDTERRGTILATESAEQRTDRVAKETATTTKARNIREAVESVEQRDDRLAKKNTAAAKYRDIRDTTESEEQRLDRLANNNKRVREYTRKRRLTDPIFLLTCRLRERLRQALKGTWFKKTAKTEELLGWSWEQTLEYLYDNPRGLKLGKDVHVDHIRPFKSFDNLACPIQQKMVNNWRNLQLLTTKENLAKGASFDHATWAKTDAGMKLLAFERELRAAAVGNDAVVTYVSDSSDDDFSDEDDYDEEGGDSDED